MIIKTQTNAGFSIVEVLLASMVFALITTGVIGAIVYGRNATASSGDRARADYIAEEGVEAVRSIRNGSITNIPDGTYGLTQTGGSWAFSGTSDTTGIFTRSITIATTSTNRKQITSHVVWNGIGVSGQVDVVNELTNWMAATGKSWLTPSLYAGLDLTGTIAGYKVDTVGNYAYLVRNSSTGPNFFVINIASPTAPVVVGSMTLAGTPTNVSVSGNYAYVSNASSTGQLQIVSVATPASPTLSGTYKAAGNAGGLGVDAIGTTVYLTRSANGGNDELVVINAATPSAPVRTNGFSLNVNMYEPYVSGSTVVIATGSDTQEVLVLNFSLGIIGLNGSIDLPGTTDATTVTGYGNYVFVGQGTQLYGFNSLLNILTIGYGTLTLPGTINDITADQSDNLVFAGTNYASGEFQVVNSANPASMSLYSSVDLPGSQNLTGVAYNTSLNVVPGANSNTAQESVVFGPN